MTAPPSERSKPRARPSRRSAASEDGAGPDQLSYREAQAALERSLVELQADDLDVERMTELYQQACAYADRCDTLLQTVEAEVMLWDPDQPDAPPQPLNP
ncbi:MAG: exodeoxyribonuclease VII small subunit [Cyanobacteriota bacterium]|nr:exodeoxyribonuclease VII small subunit [Cyanobacteriota bacterium]